ncbi:putative toxin-antitoxin system, toxin component [Leptospira santarosai str. HAI134]|nr:putative toxin-antitoxin system, toxin component [Leptospira santarosai str. HAI134]
MDLSFRLEDLLNTHVDLLTEESLTKDLRDSILSEAILIEI